MELTKQNKQELENVLSLIRMSRGITKKYDRQLISHFKKTVIYSTSFGAVSRKEADYSISEIREVQELIERFEEELKRLKSYRKIKRTLSKKNKNG